MTLLQWLMSPVLLWALNLVQLGLLLICLWRAPWRALGEVPARQHLLYGALLAQVLLWQVGGHVAPQASLHLLGMTTVSLMLGLPLAILVGSAAVFLNSLLAGTPLVLVGVNALINATLPALVTCGVLALVLRYGPRNLFAYMLGAGFVGGALSMLSTLLVMLLLFALTGEARGLREWASPILLLAMFPEGFINGAIVSSLAVYKPHWLRSYDDHYFLDGV